MLIDEALKDLDKRRKNFLSWRKAEKIALQLQKKFSQNGLTITIGLDWVLAQNGVEIYVHQCRNLDDLKSIFRFLAQKGYQREAKPIILENHERVLWKYDKNIKLYAYFNSPDENACHFKQVGTKEVPVYEIDCPGLSNQKDEQKGEKL